MIIRRGTPSDAEAIADLYVRARKAAAAVGSIPPPVHSDDEMRRWMSEVVIAQLDLWIAEEPVGRPVGMLVLHEGWIEQLYVDPSFTGRGIGTALLDLAKRERPVGLRLWTFLSNTGAQQFYERHRFVATEYTDGSGNEEGEPDVLYRWPGRQ